MSNTSQDEHDPDKATLARQSLQQLLTLMGHDAQVDSTIEQERIVLQITGGDAPALAGNRGQTLDAIQFLLGRMLLRQTRDRTPVVVDSDGYRQRRADALHELAVRLGDEVERTGKAVAVNPMSAHDRRVVHMALKEREGVSTRSEGEGDERRLLIIPDP